MNKEELKTLKDMEIGEFYSYFVETVVKKRELWTLDEDGELTLLESPAGDICIPFFATEDEALLSVSEGWAEKEVGVFDIDTFINNFVLDIAKTDLKMAIIKTDDKLIPVDFVEIKNDIEIAYEAIKGELGHPKNKRNYSINFLSELTKMRMEYTSDNDKDFELKKPTWIEKEDDLYVVFKEEELLKNEGHIYYGALVMANTLLYEEGKDVNPGFILYSTDPHYSANPYDLIDLSWQLNNYVGTDVVPDELKEILYLMETETERVSKIKLPCSITGNKDVYFTDLLFQRDHLPGGVLRGKLFPVLANPDIFRSVTVLPKYYWSDNMVKVFIDDNVPQEIIDKDKENEAKIREEILKLSNEEKYRYFIKNAVRNEAVWSIKDGDFVVFEDRKGQRWLPLWPEKEFSDKTLTGQLKNGEPTYFDVYEFSVGFTQKFGKNGWKAAVMWDDKEFIGKSFDELKIDLEEEMLNDPDWKKD